MTTKRFLACVAGLAVLAGCAAPGPGTAPGLHVGLRRSSYGGKHHPETDWWVRAAGSYAAQYAGAQPTIIEIVSVYLDDGTTQFGFSKPDSYAGTTKNMSFVARREVHEEHLRAYDKAGVSAVLQVEPGNADLASCLEVVYRKFGSHPCVIGLGVDAEWFRTRESPKRDGMPVTDPEARALVEKVLSLNPRYTLFLKHFSARHMPPTYRHPHLYFVSDSQDFGSADEMLGDFRRWAAQFAGSDTGYQFGYPADRKWWAKLDNPPAELGRRIRAEIPSCRYLFWVDFTADKVHFP